MHRPLPFSWPPLSQQGRLSAGHSSGLNLSPSWCIQVRGNSVGQLREGYQSAWLLLDCGPSSWCFPCWRSNLSCTWAGCSLGRLRLHITGPSCLSASASAGATGWAAVGNSPSVIFCRRSSAQVQTSGEFLSASWSAFGGGKLWCRLDWRSWKQDFLWLDYDESVWKVSLKGDHDPAGSAGWQGCGAHREGIL